MSGRKQHYIPQSLLRGFRAAQPGKNVQVYVYRPDRAPFLSSTEGVAAQRDFYSSAATDGQPTLDDRITRYEDDRLTSLLSQLRETGAGDAADPAVAAELVAHLATRGAFVRQTFELGSRKLIDHLATIFCDPLQARSHMGFDRHEPAPAVTAEIDQLIERLRPLLPTGLPEPLLRRMLLTLLREGFDAAHAELIAPQLTTVFAQLGDALPTLIRNGHAKALERHLAPDARIAPLARLHWRVLTAPSEDLILPDCVAITTDAQGEATCAPYLIDSDKTWDHILLPLDAAHLLVGSHHPEAFVDIGQFNPCAAACSLAFFVSARCSDDLTTLASRMGSSAKSGILAMVRDAVDGLHPDRMPSVAPASTGDETASDGNGHGHAYAVRFVDIVDQAMAERIAQVVGHVVNTCQPDLPLDRLDSIIFAYDYASALHNLDRGFEAYTPLTPTDSAIGLGIAMAPCVLRDGEIRCYIVMRAGLGEALLKPDDEDTFEIAMHTLITMLARVAFVGNVESALPGIQLQPIRDTWNAMLYGHAHAAHSSYFSARVAANVRPAAGRDYRQLLLAALAQAQELIPKERLAYRRHADLNAFLGIALPAIGNILNYAAAFLGHCDGLEQDAEGDDEELIEALNAYGLSQWLPVYRHDLAMCFARQGQWASLDELTALGSHLERLLWPFSVFAWRDDLEAVRIEIPLAVDIQALQEGSSTDDCSG